MPLTHSLALSPCETRFARSRRLFAGPPRPPLPHQCPVPFSRPQPVLYFSSFLFVEIIKCFHLKYYARHRSSNWKETAGSPPPAPQPPTLLPLPRFVVDKTIRWAIRLRLAICALKNRLGGNRKLGIWIWECRCPFEPPSALKCTVLKQGQFLLLIFIILKNVWVEYSCWKARREHKGFYNFQENFQVVSHYFQQTIESHEKSKILKLLHLHFL